jgi:hypothetical protein
MIGKKISLFKNNIKLKQASDNKVGSFHVVSKKMLALIKQKLVETPGVFVSNDVMIGPDDSCEISGIVNASDSHSSNAARGFSSLITSLP